MRRAIATAILNRIEKETNSSQLEFRPAGSIQRLYQYRMPFDPYLETEIEQDYSFFNEWHGGCGRFPLLQHHEL